jgi:competence ComEA-like helix-hairpin-helix protein
MNGLGRRGQAPVAGLGFVASLLAVLLLVTAWLTVSRPVRRVAAPGLASNVGQGPSTSNDAGVPLRSLALDVVGADATAWPDMRIDVNSAGVAELSVLPGIGPGLAKRIVAHRNEHGPFRSIDDLSDVGGIGPRIVAGLRGCAVAEIDNRAGSNN